MVTLALLNLAVAYAAGFLTFFAGCLAPVAPVYVSFLAGVSPENLDDGRKRIFLKNALLFTAGFLFVFFNTRVDGQLAGKGSCKLQTNT